MGVFFSLRGVLFLAIAMYCGIRAFKRPVFGLAFFLAMLLLRDAYLRVVFPAAVDFHFYQIFGLITLLAIFFLPAPGDAKGFNVSRVMWLLFLYVIIVNISVYSAGASLLAVKGNETSIELIKSALLSLMVLYGCRSEKDLQLLVTVIVGVVFFLFVNVYYDYRVKGMDIAASTYYFMNRNSLGALFACTVPMAMSLSFISTIRWQKIIYWLASGGMALGTILTYSRAAFLAMVVGICILFWASKQQRLFLAVVVILSLVVVGWRVSDKFFARVETIDSYQEDASAMGRVATNYAALEMVRAHPLVGIGAGNFPNRVLEFTPNQYLGWVAEGKQIHNILLQAFAENGVFGGAIFFTLIVSVFICAIKHLLRRKAFGLSSPLLGGVVAAYGSYLINAQFGQGAYYGPFFYLFPLVLIACRYAQK